MAIVPFQSFADTVLVQTLLRDTCNARRAPCIWLNLPSHTIVDDHAENSQFISSLYRLAWRWKLRRFATVTTSSEDNLFKLLAVEFKVIRNNVQFWTVLSSSQQSLVFTAGTIRYVSPTNLSLSAWSGRKYAALTKYAAGRRPEPCIMLAASRHSCDRRVHVGVPCTMRVIADKSTIQVVDLIGHVKLNNFLHYSLVSRCVKSRAKTWTYGLTDSMLHTMCRRATIAATVV